MLGKGGSYVGRVVARALVLESNQAGSVPSLLQEYGARPARLVLHGRCIRWMPLSLRQGVVSMNEISAIDFFRASRNSKIRDMLRNANWDRGLWVFSIQSSASLMWRYVENITWGVARPSYDATK